RNIRGASMARNRFSADCWIILLAAIAARDEDILFRVSDYEAVQAESHLALHQNYFSFAQFSRRHGLHVHNLAIANRRRHAGAARLKADAIPASKQLPGNGFE